MTERETHNVNLGIGKHLQQARKVSRLTQGQLAEKLSEILPGNYVNSTIAKIEAGSRTMTFPEAAAFARLLPHFQLSEVALGVTGIDVENELGEFADELRDLIEVLENAASNVPDLNEQVGEVLARSMHPNSNISPDDIKAGEVRVLLHSLERALSEEIMPIIRDIDTLLDQLPVARMNPNQLTFGHFTNDDF